MYKILFLILLYLPTLYAQNSAIENNLKHNQYKAAFAKDKGMKRVARTAEENFWWRYYYLKIALAWENPAQFKKEKITYATFQRIRRELRELKLPNKEAQRKEIENLYKKYFYPLKIVLKTKNPELAAQNQNPVGRFGFRLVETDENKKYLTPLQLQRIRELAKNERLLENNLKTIEFKIYKDKYFLYELEDVPVLQADNPNLGYVIQYAYINKKKKRIKESSGNKKATFSQGTLPERRMVILSGNVSKSADIAVTLPPNMVFVYYKEGIEDIEVKNAKVVHKNNEKKYLELEIQPKAKVLLTIKEPPKSKNKSNIWPKAIAVMAVISFILAR